MKVLALTSAFAKLPMVTFSYNAQAVFFAGDPPPINALITLELPGLTNHTYRDVSAWLIRFNAGDATTHVEDIRIPRELWRPTVLDDFIDAANYGDYTWHVAHWFTLAELTVFAEEHAPILDREIRATLALTRDERRVGLQQLSERTARIIPLITAAQRRVPQELQELLVELDREDIAAHARASVDAWIDLAGRLRSETTKAELMQSIAERLVAEDASPATVGAALDRMYSLDLHKIYTRDLFPTLGTRVPLPPTLTGQTIDLTKASEVTIDGSWDSYTADRVGPIKLGRSALRVFTVSATGAPRTIHVRGERKLKHLIKRRGGSITRWGNTLTVGIGEPNSVAAALLRVDEIDALAHLAPERAVALLGDQPISDAIRDAFAQCADDPRWRRVLADLLVERIVGIDADVARHLARAEAARNRKRRR